MAKEYLLLIVLDNGHRSSCWCLSFKNWDLLLNPSISLYIEQFIRLFLCIYLTVIHFYPQPNICFISLYGIKVYEGGKDWTRKYHKSKPLQLVTTNISLFEKELQNKEFLS